MYLFIMELLVDSVAVVEALIAAAEALFVAVLASVEAIIAAVEADSVEEEEAADMLHLISRLCDYKMASLPFALCLEILLTFFIISER